MRVRDIALIPSLTLASLAVLSIWPAEAQTGDAGDPVVSTLYEVARSLRQDMREPVRFQDRIDSLRAGHRAGTLSTDEQFQWALMLRRGLGIRAEPRLGCEIFLDLAKGGHVAAMYSYGHCFYGGVLTENAAEEVTRWYTAAANRGSSTAKCALGELYLNGQIVDKDPAKGLQLCREAAEAGSSYAQLTVGERLIRDKDDPQARERGFAWIEASAAQGNLRAQTIIATRLYYGDGVPRDVDRSLSLALSGASRNYKGSYPVLSMIYFSKFIEAGPDPVDGASARRAFYFANKVLQAPPVEPDHSRAVRVRSDIQKAFPRETIDRWETLTALKSSEFLSLY